MNYGKYYFPFYNNSPTFIYIEMVLYMKKRLLGLFLSMASLQVIASPTLSTINVGDKPVVLTEKNIEMYPAIADETSRHIIALTSLDDEQNARIELRFKKMINADCNTQSWAGQLNEQIVEGWGYNYYTLKENQHRPTTRMACAEPAKMEEKYMQGTQFLNYNSKLPIVIYTPADVSVEAVVWEPTGVYQK